MSLKFLRNLSVLISVGALGLVASGCVLRASTDEIPATAVAQNLPTLTPTNTEEPTPEPQITTEFVVITATPDETALADLQATADALNAANPQGTAIAQLDQPTLEPMMTIDPLIIETTLTIAAATQQVVDITLTAEANLFIPTLEPTQEFVQPTATVENVPPVGSGADCTHTVSAGENLFRIGLRYGVGYQTIANYNGIANPTIISIGQQIVIPACGQSTSVDGFGGGSNEGGFGGGTTGTGGSNVGAGGVCGSTYVVDQYETLFGISLRCNVLIRDIMALNPSITNPDRIYFNQTLTLP
ncbi:MAG: LysM peptidoglycan-binding domain-containing protein [Anaerolineae bacterium]|jgi:LysM repeat protein|nr:LysM peptidoglycan-binding domain-containing protein [Anaerolineae bacterium]